MYCVIYEHKSDNCYLDRTKVYYCKKKKLASAYVKRRFESILRVLSRKGITTYNHVENENDYSYARITYSENDHDGIDDSRSVTTTDTFRIIRMQEILDLENGPSLRVE